MLKNVNKHYFTADKKLMDRIDEFRYANHIPSRAEAIRQLIITGLQSKGLRPRD